MPRPLPHPSAPLLAAALALALVAASGCGGDDDDSTPGDDDVALPWAAGDAAVLAPPEGNSMGLYAMALCPGGDELYYTNLHHPHLGVVDVTTGTLAATIDLRSVTGGMAPVFAFVACHGDSDTLLVNDREGGTVIRVDPVAGTVLQVEPVCSDPGWIEVDGVSGDAWVACPDDGALARLDGVSLAVTDTVELGGLIPVRAQLAGGRLYVTDEASQKLAVVDPDSGDLLGVTAVDGRPNMVARWGDGRLFLSERLGGRVVVLDDGDPPAITGQVPAGSDPFGVLAMADRNRVYVVARQGADVPPGEAYTGQPGLLIALDPDGGPVEQVEVGETPHFVLHHPGEDLLLVGNEDSLDVTAVGPDHEVAWTTPPLGLTLDDVAADAATGRLWFPSHLSDELWVHDRATGEATALDVPWWPFAVELDAAGRRVYVATQQHDTLRAYDADSLALVDEWDLGVGTHALPCSPLCTGHPTATDLALDPERGWAYVAHPAGPSALRLALDGGAVTAIPLGEPVPPGDDDKFQHMQLAVDPADGRLYAYYNLDDRLVAVDGDAVVHEATVDSRDARPLVLDPARGRVLCGRHVLDRDLQALDTTPEGLDVIAVLTAPDAYLVRGHEELALLDPASLEVTAEFALAGLQVPPFGVPDPADEDKTMTSPVIAAPLGGGPLLVVVDVFEGSFEVLDVRDW